MDKSALPNLFSCATPLPESVNYHLLSACNMRCKFCFAGFAGVRHTLSHTDQSRLTVELGSNFRKITFVGGEPMLAPHLPQLISTAKEQGAISCLVTNGSLLTSSHIRDFQLDWITLSIDSADLETHRRIGRAIKEIPCRPDHYLDLANAVRLYDKHLKVNTVVNKLNVHEDMSRFIRQLAPDRWKIFQILPIKGENDKFSRDLAIIHSEFDAFVERHKACLNGSKTVIVPEDNRLMTGSYAMVDPLGRFFDNIDGYQHYGRSILDVGLDRAWRDIQFYSERFIERGGQAYFE